MASAHQSSANKEASSQVHVLESRVHDLAREREDLARKLSSLSDQLRRKTMGFQNLEMALAGIQEEKKNEGKIAEHAYNEMWEYFFPFCFVIANFEISNNKANENHKKFPTLTNIVILFYMKLHWLTTYTFLHSL